MWSRLFVTYGPRCARWSPVLSLNQLLEPPRKYCHIKDFPQPKTFILPFLIALAGQVLASVIVAVLLSRKSGTQGFITVEDFFGGAIIGAVGVVFGPGPSW